MTSDATSSDVSGSTAAGTPDSGAVTAQVTQLEQALWQQFARPENNAEFYRSWLALQCNQIKQCLRGVLVLGELDTGPYAPAAYWPEGQGGSGPLANLAEQALAERRGLVLNYEVPANEAGKIARQGVAYPIQIDGHLHGVVAVEVTPRSQAELQTAMRQLQWSAGWLDSHFRKQQSRSDNAVRERLTAALDLLAASLEQENYGSAVKSYVTELATQLSCDRVSFGFLKHGHANVEALSHSAQFGKQMNLIRAIGSAMDEAMDQQAIIQYPSPPDSELLVTNQHKQLAAQHGAGTILTIPLFRHGSVYAAVCFERPAEKSFDAQTVELSRSVSSIVGPVLEEKRKNDRWLPLKIIDSLRIQAVRLFGPHYVLRKLVAILIAALVVFFSFATGQYNIKADTVLEGAVQRVIVAPFEGYVAEALARAGDIVKQGELLSTLDNRDLKLERLKWSSQRAQLRKQYDEAMAKRDRAQVNIVSAQVAQADAQLALLDEQLDRTRIIAPFSGLIISGDLSQSLGASVRRGEILFEIAPLESYRIILKVSERDINEVAVGQRGELVLASMPEQVFPFSVKRITPVSTTDEGENYFRVEARLEQTAQLDQVAMERLRPGMEGAGKINVDERKLIWIWTRDIVDWLRLWVWRWTP
ncbi:HlyD family efflux transporter periplasmic adaptor subunit [Kaarinaea lacus]